MEPNEHARERFACKPTRSTSMLHERQPHKQVQMIWVCFMFLWDCFCILQSGGFFLGRFQLQIVATYGLAMLGSTRANTLLI